MIPIMPPLMFATNQDFFVRSNAAQAEIESLLKLQGIPLQTSPIATVREAILTRRRLLSQFYNLHFYVRNLCETDQSRYTEIGDILLDENGEDPDVTMVLSTSILYDDHSAAVTLAQRLRGHIRFPARFAAATVLYQLVGRAAQDFVAKTIEEGSAFRQDNPWWWEVQQLKQRL